jgi:4-amino-4-deoxy-L-arabinose transferase-like glycosyltransferase
MKSNIKLIAILALAFAFRLFLMQWRFAIGFDEPHYLQLGAAAALYGWENILHPYWPPMYPVLVAAMSIFSNDFELIGRLANIFSGTATLIPVYFLAKELFGKRTALVAALLLALFPDIAFKSTDALSESCYTLFSMSGIALGWFALSRRSSISGLLAGVFWGMAYLAKPEGLGYVAVFLGVAVLWLLRDWLRHKNLAALKVALLAVAGTILLAAPYIFYLKQATGEWTISGKYKVNRYDVTSINRLLPDNSKSPLDMAYHWGTFQEYQPETYAGNDGRARGIKSLAVKFAENIYKILRYSIAGVLSGPMFLLLGLGLFSGPEALLKIRMQLYLLAFIVFYWLMVIPFFHINERYFAPLLPLAFVWIAKGVFVLSGAFKGVFERLSSKRFAHSGSKYGNIVAASLLVVFSFLPEMAKVIGRDRISNEFWDDAVELKEAGEWLKANTAASAPVLMSYNKAVDFYAGQYDIRKTTTFSFDPVDRIVKYAQLREVDYLVVNERYRSEFSYFEDLVTGTNVPEALECVYDRVSASGLRVVIYRVNGAEIIGSSSESRVAK